MELGYDIVNWGGIAMDLNKITMDILSDYRLGRTIDTTVSVGRPTMAASEELMERTFKTA